LKPTIKTYGLGVQKITPNLHKDNRGFLGELLRLDWGELLPNFTIKQVLLSQSKPGIIRAWHKHLRNQIDLILVLKGTVKICIYDGDSNSKSFGDLIEINVDSNTPEIIKIPGHLWHGTKNTGVETSETIYFINNLYDYDNPDEERIDWDDPTIIDPNTQKPFDWNMVD